MIQSPGFGTTLGYPYNVNCGWTLTGGAQAGRNMTLHFQEFDLDEDETVVVGSLILLICVYSYVKRMKWAKPPLKLPFQFICINKISFPFI